ncbi:MAG: PEP-CTERM sorting domain-containing protein [Oscillatoriales cyanobacterium C42_A2020_001]|nr:PEP-CTERM sorting domain-containing protein [Leptolyngbyaceae cyanobacterium C42_A2020_001]
MTQRTNLFSRRAVVIAASLVSTTAIAMTNAVSSQAATFTPFSFQTNVTASPPIEPASGLLNDPTKDIRLDSIVFGGGTINQFEVVSDAKVLRNDTYTLPDGSVYGVLHSGRGPNTASDPLIGEGPSKPNPTDQDIVGSLGNLNLNSILVTRENANTASIEVSFANPVSLFFFWERGGTAGGTTAGDSDLLVEALSDDRSTVLASYKILRANYTKADYNISTQVIPVLNNGPFNLGSIGLRLDDGATKTLRLTSSNNNLGALGGDNGPDFKVVAAVPEPFTMTGALVAGGLGLMLKKRKKVTA